MKPPYGPKGGYKFAPPLWGWEDEILTESG